MKQKKFTEFVGHSFNNIYNSDGTQTPPQTPNPYFFRNACLMDILIAKRDRSTKQTDKCCKNKVF